MRPRLFSTCHRPVHIHPTTGRSLVPCWGFVQISGRHKQKPCLYRFRLTVFFFASILVVCLCVCVAHVCLWWWCVCQRDKDSKYFNSTTIHTYFLAPLPSASSQLSWTLHPWHDHYTVSAQSTIAPDPNRAGPGPSTRQKRGRRSTRFVNRGHACGVEC